MSTTIHTFTGLEFDPLNPDPKLINITDIAHSLSNLCRYTGHVRYFYSVAEHSYHASFLVRREFQMAALLHDASEAYLQDIAKPLKDSPLYERYRHLEAYLQGLIYSLYMVGYIQPPPEVQAADRTMLLNECRDLMRNHPLAKEEPASRIYLTDPMTPPEAESNFLHRFWQLNDQRWTEGPAFD
jgi:5'-deoxynucleotidase YfbR-like HD superfamily hydrolase